MFSFFKKLFKRNENVELAPQMEQLFKLADRAFQQSEAPIEKQFSQDETEDIPTYFTDKEFACKDGCGDSVMNPEFVKMLNQARHIAGKPWKINSGKRCAANNKAAGGVKSSAHTKGMAVDIAAPTGAKKFEIVQAAIRAGFTRIGIGKTFVHLDSDASKPQNTIWLY